MTYFNKWSYYRLLPDISRNYFILFEFNIYKFGKIHHKLIETYTKQPETVKFERCKTLQTQT